MRWWLRLLLPPLLPQLMALQPLLLQVLCRCRATRAAAVRTRALRPGALTSLSIPRLCAFGVLARAPLTPEQCSWPLTAAAGGLSSARDGDGWVQGTKPLQQPLLSQADVLTNFALGPGKT